jgi:hypothetical protein
LKEKGGGKGKDKGKKEGSFGFARLDIDYFDYPTLFFITPPQ